MDPSAEVSVLAKSRSAGIVTGGGVRYQFGEIPFTREYSKGQEAVIIDNTNGDGKTPNAFLLQRTVCEGSLINGQYYTTANDYVHHNNTPSRLYDNSKLGTPGDVVVPGGLENKLFANASPDRADILLPVFFWELAELPSLLYYLGRRVWDPRYNDRRGIKNIPSDWLTWNFGIAPLIGDLQKLLSFAESMTRRENEIEKLYSKNGLRRKVKLFSGTGPARTRLISVTPYPYGLPGNVTLTGHEVVKVWGTVRYTPALLPDGSPVRRPTPNEIKRRVLGLNAANISLNIWNALPWTWFIDYFAGVSDYLGANQAGRTCVPSQACIMTHRSITYRHPAIPGQRAPFKGSLTLSAGSIKAESKARTVVWPSPLPIIRVPALSGHQLSILGSLAVTKGRAPVRM